MDATVIFIKGRHSKRNDVSKSFIEKHHKGRLTIIDNSVGSLIKALRKVKTQDTVVINSSHICRRPLDRLLEMNCFSYQVSTLVVRYLKGIKCPSTMLLAGRTKNILKIFSNISCYTNNRNLLYLIGVACKKEKMGIAGYAATINRELRYHIWTDNTMRYKRIPSKYINDKVDKVDLNKIFLN